MKQHLNESGMVRRYSNKTYRVDDIEWESTPFTKRFERQDGTEISIADYMMNVRREDPPFIRLFRTPFRTTVQN